MKRWDNRIDYLKNQKVTNKKADNFLNEIISICKKYNLSIAHEDIGGAFIICNYDINNIKWLNSASISKYCKSL
jgi:hypothetical protein